MSSNVRGGGSHDEESFKRYSARESEGIVRREGTEGAGLNARHMHACCLCFDDVFD